MVKVKGILVKFKMKKDIRYYYLEDNGQSTIEWDHNKTLHRLDGPAIEYADGAKYWYQHDQRHREDGPAIELANGTKYWYQHGKYHRLDGPAIEYTNGNKYWWYKGKHIEHITSQEQYEQWLRLKAFW